MKNKKINVKGLEVVTFTKNETDFISLTDIARYKDKDRSDYLIQNWMRNRDTIEFLGLWEKINNPGFKSIEFDGFKQSSGLNSFSLTPQRWVNATKAVGIVSKKGRGGGTFAHKDIAFEFEFSTLPHRKIDELKLKAQGANLIPFSGWKVY